MPRHRHGRRWRQQGFSQKAVRMLEPTLLLLLHHGESHGYTLLEQLNEYGLHIPHPSVVYRTLRDMEERGWIVSMWREEESQGPPRRVYSLTELGHEVLWHWAKDLRETNRHISHLLKAYDQHMKEGTGEYH